VTFHGIWAEIFWRRERPGFRLWVPARITDSAGVKRISEVDSLGGVFA
jgi:hypothetical protein